MEYKLTAPLSKADAAKLRAGDTVLLSGTIYTARARWRQRASLCPLPLRTRSFITPAPRPPARAG